MFYIYSTQAGNDFFSNNNIIYKHKKQSTLLSQTINNIIKNNKSTMYLFWSILIFAIFCYSNWISPTDAIPCARPCVNWNWNQCVLNTFSAFLRLTQPSRFHNILLQTFIISICTVLLVSVHSRVSVFVVKGNKRIVAGAQHILVGHKGHLNLGRLTPVVARVTRWHCKSDDVVDHVGD